MDPLTATIKSSKGHRHCSAIGEHNDDIHWHLAPHQARRRLIIESLRALSRLANKRALQKLQHEVALDRSCKRDSCPVAGLIVEIDPAVVVEVGNERVGGHECMPE